MMRRHASMKLLGGSAPGEGGGGHLPRRLDAGERRVFALLE